MTEDTDRPEYNTERVAELIEKHRAATTRRQQREIENEVLEATVWNAGEQSVPADEGHVLSESEVQTIYRALNDSDDDEEEARFIVRSKLLKDL